MRNKIILLFFIATAIFKTSRAQITTVLTPSNVTCNAMSDGSISLSVSGDTLPIKINWYSEDLLIDTNILVINYLLPGKYKVEVIDSLGQTVLDSTEILSTAIFSIDTITDAPCYGSTGLLKIYPQNGQFEYTGYWTREIWNPSTNSMIIDAEWKDTTQTVPDTVYFYPSYPRGYYYVTIEDALGCQVKKEFEIKEPSSAVSLQETHTNIVCKFDTTGTINVVTLGGVAPYKYTWTDDATEKTAARINLKVGTYKVVAVDALGCSVTESIDITEPFQPIIIHSEVHDVSCRENQDGYVIIDDNYIENSKAPYTFNWSNGGIDNSIVDLLADTFYVTVSDANGCAVEDSFVVALNDVDCIVINNVITPDANGKNDTWIIKNIELYPDCDVTVIDRWGKIVLPKTVGYDNSWDATFDGKILDSGDYYYIVNLNTGNYPPYTGPLKIIK